MEQLFLEDLAKYTDQEVRKHIVDYYEATYEEIDKFDILIAYESVWTCYASSFFLLWDRQTSKLYEVHGSHCSCYGFEGQFEPEETTLEYLKSDNFSFVCGDTDQTPSENKDKVKNYISNLRDGV